MSEQNNGIDERPVVQKGNLVHLRVNQLRPSPQNPRKLFDPEPLATLKKSIRQHGVLVPLTVYQLPGQEWYAIVDGERRYICCCDLAQEGNAVQIPANIVNPPKPISSLIYMFNIHQFRQQWELMPTAIALQSLINTLGDSPTDEELVELTGLSAPQLERCKTILSFPQEFQEMSLDPDPTSRIPSNFWVELSPVLALTNDLLPGLLKEEGREGITRRLIEKYRKRNITSVIHFRRILEAYDVQSDDEGREAVADRLREYILTPNLETRNTFDSFVLDTRRIRKASQAADRFISDLKSAKIDYAIDDKDLLIEKLKEVLQFVDRLISKLEGDDPPAESEDDD